MSFDFTRKKNLVTSTLQKKKEEKKKPLERKSFLPEKEHMLIIECKDVLDKPGIFSDIPVVDAELGVMIDGDRRNKRVSSLYKQFMQ
ncbi:hypothetical protein NEFER03_0014 [Nematocida sp. LUAm3]|nr:hypothetical protein NEFER03_0014 [Nematocida sp. LUAm3]KAI5173496.1 hypothetical protein NEFER02_0012 [Nematocida sp. LUAm2]KAI5176689.1 hypothetical protein NEFER01_0014 [Nematocida sp. LUAm1]